MNAAVRELRGSPVLAWGICFVTLGVVATTSVLVLLNLETIHDPNEANLIEIVLSISFALLGGLVASRQPRNALGWVFLAMGLLNALPGVAQQYMRYVFTQPEAPFSAWLPWIGGLASLLIYPAGLAPLAFLLTPTGHFLSRRWRGVAWIGAGITLAAVILVMTASPMVEEGVPNPTFVPALAGLLEGPAGDIAFLAGLAVLVVAVSSVVVRLRRAQGEERLQLRWVASAAAVAIGFNLVSVLIPFVVTSEEAATVIGTLATVIGFGIVLPAGFAVAMLRYRLYDLDLLLNRTALYGAVTVVLLGAFFAANVLVQRALVSAFHQPSDLVTAGLGVTAALAFGPMRRAIRPLVDRALPARSQLTLLFTDIVQSTQAIVDLGDEQWREVLGRYRALVRRELSRHHGREVDTAGDAFFAVFARPVNAVRCASAMRDGVKAVGLRVRTGIHCGEVAMRGEGVTGLAVHAAARVMALAGEDQVLISDDVAQQLDNALALRDAGRHELRGVPGTWHLYEVGSESH